MSETFIQLYVSPFSLYETCFPEELIDPPELDEQRFRKIRKHLKLEFELQQEINSDIEYVQIGNYHLNHAQFQKITDWELFESNRTFHLFLFRHKDLLQFMESGLFPDDSFVLINETRPHGFNSEEQKMLTGLIDEQVMQSLMFSLKHYDFRRVYSAYQLKTFLNEDQQSILHDNIGSELNLLHKLIVKKSRQSLLSGETTLPLLDVFRDPFYVKFLNQLPTQFAFERFIYTRASVNLIMGFSQLPSEHVVEALKNLSGVTRDHVMHTEFCKETLDHYIQNKGKFTREFIRKDNYHRNYWQKKEEQKSRLSSTGCVIMLVIALVVLLIASFSLGILPGIRVFPN